MSYCKTIDCGNPVENRDTGLCASCGAAIRKGLKQAAKEKKHTPIKKVSEKRKKENGKYLAEAILFLKGKNCAVYPHLKATEVHHKKGRNGYADQWAKDHGITLLMDKRLWLPVSSEGHRYITENSKWAIEMGFSVERNNLPELLGN
jgi:hypothetical protein